MYYLLNMTLVDTAPSIVGRLVILKKDKLYTLCTAIKKGALNRAMFIIPSAIPY